MGAVNFLRPNNPRDPAAGDLSAWCRELEARLQASGHTVNAHISDVDPCDRANVNAALNSGASVTFFFGHGTSKELLGTSGGAVLDSTNAAKSAGQSIVAVACRAARELGSDAVTAGATAFLGWKVKLLWLKPPAGQLGPFGEAIVDSLELLGGGHSLEDALDELTDRLDAVAEYYNTGAGAGGSNSKIAHYAAAAAAGRVALDGVRTTVPL